MRTSSQPRKLASLAIVFSVMTACGSSDSSKKEAAAQDPNGPVAAGLITLKIAEFIPTFSVISPVGAANSSASLALTVAEDIDSEDPKKARLANKKIEDATTLKECLAGFDRKKPERNALCYGTGVWVTDYHPDGIWPANMQHILPPGDLGFMTVSEQKTTEACAAAKMNSLIGNLRTRADEGLEMSLRAGCFARVLGKTLPANVGETLSLSTSVNEALKKDSVTNLTFNKIDITLQSISGSIKTFKTEVDASGPRGPIWTLIVQKRTSDTEAEGYMWGIGKPLTPGGKLQDQTSPQAFSIIFKESGNTLTYDATQSRVETTEVAGGNTAVFEADKRVRVASSGKPGYDHVMTTMNTSTLAGETIYLWNAGSQLEQMRIMHVKIQGEGNARSGVGYFGFGKSLGDFRAALKAGSLAGTASIEKMICNWAGPNNSKTGVAAAQKQTLTFDAASGFFSASASNIGFSARNDCGVSGNDANYKWAAQTTDNVQPAASAFSVWANYNLVDLATEKETLKIPAILSSSL